MNGFPISQITLLHHITLTILPDMRDYACITWTKGPHMQSTFSCAVLGPPVMRHLRTFIRGCPEPYEVEYAGHFTQEWGEEIAAKALEAFSKISNTR
jgi:hypothetical protein